MFEGMVEVEIDSIRVSLMSQHRIVILKDIDSERFLPIWIGPYEAEAITVSLQETEVLRPLTHDLLRNVLQTLGAEVLRINITELRDDVFYARIVLRVDGREVEIDSRPSDAIALAVRCDAKIFASEEVIEESSIEFQAEDEEQRGLVTASSLADLDPAEFRKFLETVTPEDFALAIEELEGYEAEEDVEADEEEEDDDPAA